MPVFEKLRLAACLCVVTSMSSMHASTITEKYSENFSRSHALGTSALRLLGDETNKYNGQTRFNATDLSLPDNNGLKYDVSRRFVAQTRAFESLRLDRSLSRASSLLRDQLGIVR